MISSRCHAFSQTSPSLSRRSSFTFTSRAPWKSDSSNTLPTHLQRKLSLIYDSAPKEQDAVAIFSNKQPKRNLHPPTIAAISQAILIRSQNKPEMPLRFIENGTMEPWEITLTAGKIAQPRVEAWRDSLPPDTRGDSEVLEEEMQVMAGRIVAAVSRLEEIEEELLRRCERWKGPPEDWSILGVPLEEISAWQRFSDVDRIEKAIAAIDAACLFDEKLRHNRARTLFAMFLHDLEGPGLLKNNVVLPCMDVDFLDKKEWDMLFGSSVSNKDDVSEKVTSKAPVVVENKNENDATPVKPKEETNAPSRPSLHPLAIDAIEESFRLRAKNMTTSPLRMIDSSTDWFDIEYSAMKFADRFLQQHSKPNDKGFQWTEEELHTIGGRIVGVLMRLDDLEWEWNHRVRQSPLGQIESPKRIPDDEWKLTLGLHPGVVEQVCFRTVDKALSEDPKFARKRAEMMYALFLMNIEEPALKASGDKVPGGSFAKDFIADSIFLELMMPRLKK